jgi:hypothetical protein
MRQRPNLRKKLRERPQTIQRFFFRVLNFGSLFNLSNQLVLAIIFSLLSFNEWDH